MALLGQLGNGRAGVGVTTRSRSANLSTSAALRSVSEATAGLPDIDAADRDDPLQVRRARARGCEVNEDFRDKGTPQVSARGRQGWRGPERRDLPLRRWG